MKKAKRQLSKNQSEPIKPVRLNYLDSLGRASKSWVQLGIEKKAPEGVKAHIYILGFKQENLLKAELKNHLSATQIEAFIQSKKALFESNAEAKLSYLLCPFMTQDNEMDSSHGALLTPSDYSKARDAMGSLMQKIDAQKSLTHVDIHFVRCSKEFMQGALLGLDLAAYKFKTTVQGSLNAPALRIFKDKTLLKAKDLFASAQLAAAMNLARHLVNLPPNILNPSSYAEFARNLFQPDSTVRVEIWDKARLQKENMHLVLAVGGAAAHSPCLVQISYRPKAKSTKKPVAFVGKGITFDSGGLDIKPSSGMRLMKKDMGGSASVLGLAYWVSQARIKIPCDFYLSLAENAISSQAFRPGDILQSRNGKTVEIHNTDAEGRLVLADALDVAVSKDGADDPRIVINLATLTGAIKVGLGADLAGLFVNDDSLATRLERSASLTGDWCWRMPLFQKYRGSMKSTFADMTNSVDGFGGAITAALFLQNFIKDKPWAHLDIYSWVDSAEGPFTEGGGNGQSVQMLSHWLKDLR